MTVNFGGAWRKVRGVKCPVCGARIRGRLADHAAGAFHVRALGIQSVDVRVAPPAVAGGCEFLRITGRAANDCNGLWCDGARKQCS